MSPAPARCKVPSWKPCPLTAGGVWAVRQALHLTQTELAELVGTARGTVARWEAQGARTPPLALLALVHLVKAGKGEEAARKLALGALPTVEAWWAWVWGKLGEATKK